MSEGILWVHNWIMLIHPQIDPIALQLGPLAVHWYGLTYLAAFGLFFWLGVQRLSHPPFKHQSVWQKRDVEDILFLGVLGVVLGGRVGYCLFYKPAYYLSNPLEIFAIWQGGMSFHGGLLGVILMMVWFAQRRLHIAQGARFADRFWAVADYVAPLVPLGLAAGRLGNFINGELWGRVADPAVIPWAMVFPQSGTELPRHPSQLYQFLGEGLILFWILFWLSRRSRPRGVLACSFLIGYGLLRFLAEFGRAPDAFLGLLPLGGEGLSLSLSMGQWLSLPMVVLGLIGIRVCMRSRA